MRFSVLLFLGLFFSFVLFSSVVFASEHQTYKLKTSSVISPSAFVEDPEFSRSLAAHFRSVDPELAFLILKYASVQFPSDKRVWNDFGVLSYDTGRFDNSLFAFSRAVSLDSGYELARFNRAVLYNYLGMFEDAVSDLSFLVDSFPENPQYWYDLAMNEAALERRKSVPDLAGLLRVRSHLVKADSLSPGFAFARENIRVLDKMISELS